jgi:hypothetical protein
MVTTIAKMAGCRALSPASCPSGAHVPSGPALALSEQCCLVVLFSRACALGVIAVSVADIVSLKIVTR